jgi:hypothetical protein
MGNIQKTEKFGEQNKKTIHQTIEFKFFYYKSFKKNSWSKFLKLLYSTNLLFILGIAPLI